MGRMIFLETAVGVRWLMPGDVGEEIPALKALTVSATDRTETPSFSARAIHDIQNGLRPPNPGDRGPQEVDRWLLRRKCPNIFDRLPNRFDESSSSREKILYGHSWSLYITPDDMKAHPEFQAVSGGKGKFCTSNPEAIALFAQRVVEWLDKHPGEAVRAHFPAGRGRFLQMPEVHGPRHEGLARQCFGSTPVILKFYNDVAGIVGRKYPDRILGGLVYYNYMYPPSTPVKMEPNVHLVLAALNYYGWGLAKPVYREEFPRLISAWTAVTPNLGYCSYLSGSGLTTERLCRPRSRYWNRRCRPSIAPESDRLPCSGSARGDTAARRTTSPRS